MPSIPLFPAMSALELDHFDAVQNFLLHYRDGISELSMASLYPFTAKRNYQVFGYYDTDKNLCYGFIGDEVEEEMVRKYAFFPAGFPGIELLQQLLPNVSEINTIGENTVNSWSQGLALLDANLEVIEDRDNADYIYDRISLIELQGQALHKKLAHALKFAEDNPNRALIPANLCSDQDMLDVLYAWAEGRVNVEDLHATEIAIRHRKKLGLRGAVLYSNDLPVAFTLGEQEGTSRFIIHIEKALASYRGIYQYINRAFAASLNESVTEINREQDLGIPGLRQAKLTYKPSRFGMKYRIIVSDAQREKS